MTNQEIHDLAEKIYARVKGVPGVDRELIIKCLTGIALLKDKEVEEKLRRLLRFV